MRIFGNTKIKRHKAVKTVRKLRHWKQKFQKNAVFVWRKDTLYAGELYEAGSLVPEGLLVGAKERRFWESHRIELHEFIPPNVKTGQVDAPALPEGVTVEPGKRGWYVIRFGDEEIKAHGVKKRDAKIDELRQSIAAAAKAAAAKSKPKKPASKKKPKAKSAAESKPKAKAPKADDKTAKVTKGAGGWYTIEFRGEEHKVRSDEGVRDKLIELGAEIIA